MANSSCNQCAAKTCCSSVSRRSFLAQAGVASLSAFAPSSLRAADPARQQPIRNTLKVQPVLIYSLAKRREATSWRSWGALQTEQDIADEKQRIGRELKQMSAGIDFPLDVRPIEEAQTVDQAARIAQGDHDVVLQYAASGSGQAIEKLTDPNKFSIMFVRHRSGPVYLWYEIAHPRFLRKTVDEYGQPGMDVHDVVVDSHAEILWRLRALYGLKNTLGKRIVAVGGPSGWGAGGRKAPEIARSQWKMDIQTVPYPDLGERIKKAHQSDALVRRCRAEAAKYISGKNVTLETSKTFVENAFLLTEVFRDLLDEAKTDAITINSCMGTIMPMSETTACLPLSLLNDDGYMAFCESDFVVVPSGVLLHYISDKPVFLNDPTYPHDQVVTIAHCTAPRKLDGVNLEPVRILTHFESDYGAAPKVEWRKGEKVTNLIPDFASKNWVGFASEVVDNPFLAICRSQVDVGYKGDEKKLLEKMGGFHWMSSYGDYVKESGYALKKVGAELITI